MAKNGRKRRGNRLGLRRKRRGMTLVELLVALVVIATASFGLAISFYTAYGQLLRQEHRMRANEFLRAKMEYWIGRIHSRFPTPFEMQTPEEWEQVEIDPGLPGVRDPLYGYVRKTAIVPFDDPETKQQPDYWQIQVVIEYTEPAWFERSEDQLVQLSLEGYWIQAVQG